jgi:hypothetical protein
MTADAAGAVHSGIFRFIAAETGARLARHIPRIAVQDAVMPRLRWGHGREIGWPLGAWPSRSAPSEVVCGGFLCVVGSGTNAQEDAEFARARDLQIEKNMAQIPQSDHLLEYVIEQRLSKYLPKSSNPGAVKPTLPCQNAEVPLRCRVGY